MDTASIAERDVLGEPGEDPVHARHHGLHDLDAVQAREGVCGVSAGEGKNPEIDIELIRAVAWDANDLDFSGKISQ